MNAIVEKTRGGRFFARVFGCRRAFDRSRVPFFPRFETSRAFASLKPQSRSPPIIRLFRLAHHSPRPSSSSGRQSRVVRIVAKDQNSRPSLNDVAEFKTSQKIPARPPYKSPCSQAHRKLDRALASGAEKTTPRREA